MSETKTLLTAYIQGLSDLDCEKLWNFLNSEASSKTPSVGKNEAKEKDCSSCRYGRDIFCIESHEDCCNYSRWEAI